MKRSEALAAIDKKLRGTVIDQDNFAEQILSTVEELGMLPPHDEMGHPMDFRYQWEPEQKELLNEENQN